MANVELKQYLGHVLDAEKDVLVLSRTVDEMSVMVNALGRAAPIDKPLKSRSSAVPSILQAPFLGIIAGAIIAFVFAWIRGMVTAKHGDSSGIEIVIILQYVWSVFTKFFGALFDSWLVIGLGAAIGAGIGLVVGIGTAVLDVTTTRRSNESEKRSYSTALAQDETRVSRELAAKPNAIKYRDATRKQLHSTQRVLSDLYGLNILHANYRNLAAVSSLYQFIDSGTCDTLKEAQGLLWHEEWYRGFGSKLDDILDAVDDIKANQYVLIDSVRAATQKIERLTQVSQLTMSYAKATARNSEVIAYNTDVTARNTSALMWMKLFEGL